MIQTRIRLTRAELYEKVWATPCGRWPKNLACPTLVWQKSAASTIFPVPPVGYWRRKETGYKVTRPQFRAAKDGHEHLDIYIRERLRPEGNEVTGAVYMSGAGGPISGRIDRGKIRFQFDGGDLPRTLELQLANGHLQGNLVG